MIELSYCNHGCPVLARLSVYYAYITIPHQPKCSKDACLVYRAMAPRIHSIETNRTLKVRHGEHKQGREETQRMVLLFTLMNPTTQLIGLVPWSWEVPVDTGKKRTRGHPHQNEQGDHEPGQRSTATNCNCMKPHTQSTLTSTSCTGFSPLIKIGTVNAIIIIITKFYNDGLCRV